MNSTKDTLERKLMVFRTALIGAKPADQTILKSYLHILLRLEVNLEWVPANHSHVDLFIVAEEYRYSNEILDIIKGQSQAAVLYVSRTAFNRGEMQGDRIILPLRKIDALNDWLRQSLPALVSKQDADASISNPVAYEDLQVDSLQNLPSLSSTTVNEAKYNLTDNSELEK